MRRIYGFSFVELLVASVILMLAVIPTFTLLLQNLRGVRITADQLEATNLACSTLEALQGLSFDDLVLTNDPDGVPLEDLDPSLQSLIAVPLFDRDRFALKVAIDPASAHLTTATPPSDVLDLADLRIVRVICFWKTQGFGGGATFRRDRSIQFSTIISRAVHR